MASTTGQARPMPASHVPEWRRRDRSAGAGSDGAGGVDAAAGVEVPEWRRRDDRLVLAGVGPSRRSVVSSRRRESS